MLGGVTTKKQSKVDVWESEPQKKQRKMLLRDGTTKGTKKTKDTKKMLLRVGTTKETKKKKRQKKKCC